MLSAAVQQSEPITGDHIKEKTYNGFFIKYGFIMVNRRQFRFLNHYRKSIGNFKTGIDSLGEGYRLRS